MPSTKSQTSTNVQNTNSYGEILNLDIAIWNLLRIWKLKFGEFVKSRKGLLIVIPAKAGIQ
jgi:hypothetical protein